MEIQSKKNIKPFDGENYNAWKFRIRSLLNQLNVIHVIDNETPADMNDEWLGDDSLAKNTIVEYLDDCLLHFAEDNETAKLILEKMDEIYHRKSTATQIAIRKKLLNFKLSGDETLRTHFMKFDLLIKELIGAGAKIEESDKIAQLLITLPASYEGVITAIETLGENSLTLAFVKTRLLDQEVKINNEARDTSHKVLQTIEIAKNSSNHNKHKFNNNFKRIHKKPLKCHYCKKIGHIKKNCFMFKRNNEKYQHKNNNSKSVQVAEKESQVFAFMSDRASVKNNINDLTFIIDSGASDHIVNDENLFDSSQLIQPPIKIAIAKNNTFIEATMRGKVKLMTNDNTLIILKDVLLCKEIPNNLISVRKMQEACMCVAFNEDGIVISKDDVVVFKGNVSNNIPKIRFKLAKTINYVNRNDYLLWHGRLGHVGVDKFNEIKRKNLFSDVEILKNVHAEKHMCEACIQGKQARLKYQQAKDKAYIQRPLFVIHTDVCGPISPETIDEKKYFVIYVDDFTHYCVTYIIKRKSDVFYTFKDFVAKASSHFDLKVVTLYSDNGTEYLSNDMKQFCLEHGISYHLTVPHSPQLNGVAERMIRTLTEKARTLIHSAKLDQSFWGEAVQAATYLTNICPSKAVRDNRTPYEMWHKRKPQLKYLKVFGSTVYVHRKVKDTKFGEKTFKGILVGYDPNGYRVWYEEAGKFVVARDVIVDESSVINSRPSLQSEKVQVESSTVPVAQKNPAFDMSGDVMSESMTLDNGILESDVHNEPNKPESMAGKRIYESDSENEIVPDSMVHGPSDDNDNEKVMESADDSNKKNTSKVFLRRSERIKSLSQNNYTCNSDLVMCAQAFISDIPKCFDDIEGRTDHAMWEKAIKSELDSLHENNTWTIVPKPENKNIVDCRWIFTIKNDEFGNVSKYKARLVAKGFSQEYLSDYEETFAPVARMTSFRFMMAFAIQFDLLVHHMDVRTAFLNGKLKEEIFMRIPDGVQSEENQVCRLNKALYGLKQAARCWFETFETTLLERGFKNSPVDRCIYVINAEDIKMSIYVVLYVDDIVIATACPKRMSNFKDYLKNKFKMTDLNTIKFFLGIKVERKENKITLDQAAYINRLLGKFGMLDCNSVSTPLPTKMLIQNFNVDENTNYPIRNLIGGLMYLMLCTRPDLSIAVNILSRFSNKNNEELWQHLKRILRYVKGTINLKLTYTKSKFNDILSGFVDSDWGGDTIDRKSTSGFLFKLFEKNTICWNSCKQSTVAASSTEAEYMALFEAVREALWLKSLSESIGYKITCPIKIYEDNQGCISIAKHPTCHKRSKHIDVKYHFCREKVEKNIIDIIYIPTDKQVADMFTKVLPKVKFNEFKNDVGLM